MSGTAERMAKNQKQVAISEFFEKNKHFLGFDSLTRSLITAVKEAVDNSLDACEEARILPKIRVQITKIDDKKNIIELKSEDNGPGIPQRSIEKVFGQLLFGSRFHAIRQSRGQQGIGITGVVMYSQLTTGRKTHVRSKSLLRHRLLSLISALIQERIRPQNPTKAERFGKTQMAPSKSTGLKSPPV